MKDRGLCFTSLFLIYCLVVLVSGACNTGIPPNSLPVADAGEDQSVNTGTLVSLNGSGSSDPDGNTLSYSWSFSAKPDGSYTEILISESVNPTFKPDIDGIYTVQLVVNDGTADSEPDTVNIEASYNWNVCSPCCILVDDYQPSISINIGSRHDYYNGKGKTGANYRSYDSINKRSWYYSRIGTDRGEMGSGNYSINIGGGITTVNVKSGWAGVWTSLLHTITTPDQLAPNKLLGPHVKNGFHPYVTGVEIQVSSGSGDFKVELKDMDDNMEAEKKFKLEGGKQVLQLSITPVNPIKKLNWLLNGRGSVTVDEVRLLIQSPHYTIPEAVFLFSYSHLSQCYDSNSGLVRDRARWPVGDFSSVPGIGTFALATAVAWDLGYIETAEAQTIIARTKDALLSIPTYKGLLPHFLTNNQIADSTEWSSFDTVVALVSEILACQAVGIETTELETMIKNIDWADLTDSGNDSIGMGYDNQGNKLDTFWDTFGSESFIMAITCVAATGNVDVKFKHSNPPTWDGSGFNDELAALLFPMVSIDIWGNNWSAYRRQAAQEQLAYFSDSNYPQYKDRGLYGLSASEVPEPWAVAENLVYGSWGIGGHNGFLNDGSSIAGYPIVAPHYAALVSIEEPAAYETLFGYLIEMGLFSPLNNVESLGIDSTDRFCWNSLKGSWNLSLQALASGRLLSRGKYLPYRSLTGNIFLYQGFEAIMEQ